MLKVETVFVISAYLFASEVNINVVIPILWHCEIKQGDECSTLADFNASTVDMKYSFSNFSFKASLSFPENLSP